MDIASLTASATQSQSASSGAFSQLTDNFDTFLTLLTTQLRNQDPLEPLDTEQFTQQLVQFAGVEQSIQTNSNLEALIALQSTSDRQASLDLVGRVASVNNNEINISGTSNDNIPAFRYTLPQNAETLSLNIVDRNGTIARSLDGQQNAGTHSLIWDGRLENGLNAPAGTYRLEAAASRNDGTAFIPTIETRNLVDGVIFNNGEPQISVGGKLVSLDAVTRVDARF